MRSVPLPSSLRAAGVSSVSGYVTVQLDLSRFCRLTAGTTIPYTLWNTVVSHQLDPSVRFPSQININLSELIQGLHVGLMSSVSSMSKPCACVTGTLSPCTVVALLKANPKGSPRGHIPT